MCLRFLYLFSLLLLFPLKLLAQTGFETAPILLQARDLLPVNLLNSPNYSIDPQVTNDGYINTYKINSAVGNFETRGQIMLEIRINEVNILVELEKKYPSTSVAADAVYNTGKNIVTAPIRAVSKTYDTVSNPTKLKDTVVAIPGGVWNIFSTAASAVGSGASFAYNTGKNAVGGGESDESTGDKFGQAVDFVSNKALDFAGYNKAAMDLMKEYSIDPYTTNPVLRGEIRRIAGIQSSVGVAGKFVPGIPSIPFVGTFNRYVKTAGDISAYDDPEKLNELNKKILKTIGDNDGLKSNWDKGFVKSPAYNPFTRALLLNNLNLMLDVKGKAQFVTMASKAPDLDAGMFYLSASKKLLEIHQKNGPLKEIISEVALPAGLTVKDALYVPLPVDYIFWTKQVATIFKDYETRVIKTHKLSQSILLIAGKISPRARAEFLKNGAEGVLDNQGY